RGARCGIGLAGEEAASPHPLADDLVDGRPPRGPMEHRRHLALYPWPDITREPAQYAGLSANGAESRAIARFACSARESRTSSTRPSSEGSTTAAKRGAASSSR